MEMDRAMLGDMGFVANNVDAEIEQSYAYTELVRRAQEGDQTALYKIEQIKRHYSGACRGRR